MNIFKSYTFSWWEMGIFKLALIAIGISVGIYWQAFFIEYIEVVWSIAILSSIYSMYIAIRQIF